MENKRIIQHDVKSILPHGAVTLLSKRSGKTIHTVLNVLKGQSQNKEVLRELATYLKELAQTKEAIKTSMDSLTDN